MRLRELSCLLVLLGGVPCACAQPRDPTKSAQVFGLTKVHSMHLTILPENWEKMQPARGGFSGNRSRPGQPELSDERKLRGGFNYDFEYVKADLEINGVLFKDVAVRFKGNSTYLLTSSYLKRPFKIDLDRYHESQAWHGLKKLTLNNNVMDPSATREPLAHMVYRAAGVPSPRTAFLELTLTVPGKYDKTLVGLYTLIESVDKTFLKEHFASAKGLLCKPERAGPLVHLGENWANYEAAYRPKNNNVTPEMQSRLIEFTRLIHRSPEAEFHQKIASFLEVDRFLRYVAATVVLASMDSFVGLAHNYYLYLDPKTNKFSILPWDVDHSFGALTMLGSASDLMNLSIRKPAPGNNRLIERLLADEKHYKTYENHIRELLRTTFTLDWVKTNAELIARTIEPCREREKQAIAQRGEAWNSWKMLELFNPPPKVETFAEKRIASLEAQLAGKSEGKVLRVGRPAPPPGPEQRLVPLIVRQADRDQNGSLSRDEVKAAVRQLFDACDVDKRGELDLKTLTSGLEKLIPRQGGLFGPPSPAGVLARNLFARASHDGKLTANMLIEAADNLFDQTDRQKTGQLTTSQLSDLLRELVTPNRPPLADRK